MIWSNPLSFAPLCYFVNRYAPLIIYIPIMVLFHDPAWTVEVSSTSQ